MRFTGAVHRELLTLVEAGLYRRVRVNPITGKMGDFTEPINYEGHLTRKSAESKWLKCTAHKSPSSPQIFERNKLP